VMDSILGWIMLTVTACMYVVAYLLVGWSVKTRREYYNG
jgi:hypothetical protein